LLPGANRELAEKLFTRRCLVEHLERPELYDLTLDDTARCIRKARHCARTRVKTVEVGSPHQKQVEEALAEQLRNPLDNVRDVLTQDESGLQLDSWTLSPWKDNITPSTGSPLSRAREEATGSAVSSCGPLAGHGHHDVELFVKESVERVTGWVSDELLAMHQSLDVRLQQVEFVLNNDCATLLERQGQLAVQVDHLQAGMDEQMSMLEDFDMQFSSTADKQHEDSSPKKTTALDAELRDLQERLSREEGNVSMQLDVLRSGFDSHRESIAILQQQVQSMESNSVTKSSLPELVATEVARSSLIAAIGKCEKQCSHLDRQLVEVHALLEGKAEASSVALGMELCQRKFKDLAARCPEELMVSEELAKLGTSSSQLTERLTALEARAACQEETEILKRCHAEDPLSTLSSEPVVLASPDSLGTTSASQDASTVPGLDAQAKLDSVESKIQKHESWMQDLFVWLEQMRERELGLCQVVRQMAEMGFPTLLNTCHSFKFVAPSPSEDARKDVSIRTMSDTASTRSSSRGREKPLAYGQKLHVPRLR